MIRVFRDYITRLQSAWFSTTLFLWIVIIYIYIYILDFSASGAGWVELNSWACRENNYSKFFYHTNEMWIQTIIVVYCKNYGGDSKQSNKLRKFRSVINYDARQRKLSGKMAKIRGIYVSVRARSERPITFSYESFCRSAMRLDEL